MSDLEFRESGFVLALSLFAWPARLIAGAFDERLEEG